MTRYPFDIYRIGTRYGAKGSYWQCGFHSGVDFLSSNYGGDGKIHPIYSGVVQKITTTGSYGNCVYIKHDDGYISLYAHMKSINVSAGAKVDESTVLGIEGATGNVTGTHLHIEIHKGVYKYPATIDPLIFISDRMEAEKEVKQEINIKLNGKIKKVTAIESEGHNYVMLQDLRDDKISIDYDSVNKLPVVEVVRAN